MEDANESQGCRKFPGICKLLLDIYPEFQSYSKTIKQVKGKERMDMERRTQGEDNKSAGTLSSKERRKI